MFATDYLSQGRELVQDAVNESLAGNETEPECNLETSDTDTVYSIIINILVFFTVWGISTVVELKEFQRSFKKPPIYIGAAFQFILMPFIGFITVVLFPLEPLEAVALLILTSSPGGSFSNWWCNLFNADLALSVSMTSLSTVASIGMLPLNILLYVELAFTAVQDDQDIEDGDSIVDFTDLGITLGVVIVGIITGLLFGVKFPQYQFYTNMIGNVAGLASILFGVVASTETCDGTPPWRAPFYPLWVGTAFPLLVALAGTMLLGKFLNLKKPQRVAISLETAYQNTSISIAYTITQGPLGREAAGVPIIYGGYEAGFFFLFMVWAWKAGWTFAPADAPLMKTLFDNWQPGSDHHKELYPELYDDEDKEDSNEGTETPLDATDKKVKEDKDALGGVANQTVSL